MSTAVRKSIDELLLEKILLKNGSFLLVGRDRPQMSRAVETVAKKIACKEYTGDDFCGQCRDCQLITAEQHPDICWVRPSGASAKIKIEDIRILKEKINLKPFQIDRKIFIISDAQRMGPEAANALLKTLEEPPQNASLILMAESVSELLPTVVSRCQVIRFSQGKEQQSDEARADERLVAGFFEADKPENLDLYEQVCELDRSEVEQLLYELACIMRDILMYGLNRENIRMISEQPRENIEKWVGLFSASSAESLLEEVLKTKRAVNKNANMKLAIDLLIKKFSRYGS